MSTSAARWRHLRQPPLLLALGFGTGLAPRMPGTVGTGVGVLIYLLAIPAPAWAQYALTLGVVLAGFPLCAHAAKRLGVHDDPAIVWDEIAGYLVAMTALPAEPVWIVAAFVLFRLLDATKPLLIGQLDRQLTGGLGIMADDLLAGAVTAAVLQAAHLLISA